MLFGKKNVVMLRVLGMTCGHCAARVIESLESVEGVRSATVKLSRHEAKVVLSADVPTERLLEAVGKAGYEASPL